MADEKPEAFKHFKESSEQRALHSYQRGLAVVLHRLRFYRDLAPEMAERGGAGEDYAGTLKASLEESIKAVERSVINLADCVASVHEMDQMPSVEELTRELKPPNAG